MCTVVTTCLCDFVLFCFFGVFVCLFSSCDIIGESCIAPAPVPSTTVLSLILNPCSSFYCSSTDCPKARGGKISQRGLKIMIQKQD